jgi:hypothetical protein
MADPEHSAEVFCASAAPEMEDELRWGETEAETGERGEEAINRRKGENNSVLSPSPFLL